MNSAIIILAAGSSSRLGKPKQLLSYHGKSLINHVISVAENSIADEIIVVLGSHYELIIKEIPANKKLRVIINAEWEEGIASSIRAGLKLLQQGSEVDAAIFTVCDQPFITTSLLNNLIEMYQQSKMPIVASSYENTIGTPVLFDKNLFEELLLLKGDSGAKKMIVNHKDKVATIPFPKGNIDIDTNDEYEDLMK